MLELGATTPQSNADGFYGVYPADNQTGVELTTAVEAPNPFPDLSPSNTDFLTKTGYPVSVITQVGKTLDVDSFTLTESGNAAPLSVRVMTAANDPNRKLLSNVAFMIANAPLKSGTSYQVSFTGHIENGTSITKSWTFTTK